MLRRERNFAPIGDKYGMYQCMQERDFGTDVLRTKLISDTETWPKNKKHCHFLPLQCLPQCQYDVYYIYLLLQAIENHPTQANID